MNLMQQTISDLWAVIRYLIDDAHGEACPDCRPPVVDTRSLAYYFHCILANDSQYRKDVADLKAEIRAVSQDPAHDPHYLGFLKIQLRDLGEEPDPTDPFEEVPF
jgi:hypothetical protein